MTVSYVDATSRIQTVNMYYTLDFRKCVIARTDRQNDYSITSRCTSGDIEGFITAFRKRGTASRNVDYSESNNTYTFAGKSIGFR